MAIAIRITESRAYPIDRWHLRRALIGGWWSREYFGFTHGGTLYGVDTTHQGSGADCRQNASLVSATRIEVTLGSGTQTATQVATSIAAAITAAIPSAVCSITATYNVDNVECVTLQISGASGLFLPPVMPYAHEALRGMWGAQRTDFGAANLGSSVGVNATASYRFTTPAVTHRAIGAYSLTGGGAADLRMGLADGPAYSTTPGAFSNGIEANAGQASSDGTRVAPFSAPAIKTSAQNVWVTWRGTATATIRSRAHGGSPVGNGDAVVGERIISNATPTNPATAIYTAGAYTHVAPSNFAFYPAIGYLYEVPDGAGNYYSTSAIRTYNGRHAPYSTTGSTTSPADSPGIDELNESFRFRAPWACRVGESLYFDLADNASGEDGYLEFYDWTAASSMSAVNPTGAIPRLLEAGRCNASTGSGRKATTTAGVAVDAADIIAPNFRWGRVGGGPLVTLTTRWHGPGGPVGYLTEWTDNGREWSDFIDSGESMGLGLRGVDAQYLTVTAGGMPVGVLSSGDDPYDVDATDLLPDNHFSHAVSISRPGLLQMQARSAKPPLALLLCA